MFEKATLFTLNRGSHPDTNIAKGGEQYRGSLKQALYR